MALLARLFGPPKPRDPVAAERVKGWVRRSLATHGIDASQASITVSEIVCNDPVCPGFETVVLMLRPNHPTEALKLSQPIDAIDERTVAAAVADWLQARAADRNFERGSPAR